MTRVMSGVPRLSASVCVFVCVCESSSHTPVLSSLGASGTSQEEGLEGGGVGGGALRSAPPRLFSPPPPPNPQRGQEPVPV